MRWFYRPPLVPATNPFHSEPQVGLEPTFSSLPRRCCTRIAPGALISQSRRWGSNPLPRLTRAVPHRFGFVGLERVVFYSQSRRLDLNQRACASEAHEVSQTPQRHER